MTDKKFVPIGLSSVATGGKDTCYKCLETILKEYGITTRRFGLADFLKSEINEFSIRRYNISSYTSDPNEKLLLRNLMVSHGKIMRELTDGKYWTGLLTEPVQNSINDGELPIITDIRFSQFNNDELQWLKSFNGLLVHIERILPNGQLLLPPNQEEKENDPKLKSVANYHLRWETTNDESVRLDYVKIQLAPLINKILDSTNCPACAGSELSHSQFCIKNK